MEKDLRRSSCATRFCGFKRDVADKLYYPCMYRYSERARSKVRNGDVGV